MDYYKGASLFYLIKWIVSCTESNVISLVHGYFCVLICQEYSVRRKLLKLHFMFAKPAPSSRRSGLNRRYLALLKLATELTGLFSLCFPWTCWASKCLACLLFWIAGEGGLNFIACCWTVAGTWKLDCWIGFFLNELRKPMLKFRHSYTSNSSICRLSSTTFRSPAT